MVIKDGVLIKINKYNKLFKKCVIPKRVKEIGKKVFSDCDSLERIIIPDSVKCIDDSAFKNCASLKEVILPQGLKIIFYETFSHCESLEKIVIPDSVTDIGNRAFSYCTSLKEISLPDSVISICDYAFSYCASFEKIVIPGSVASIGNHAFENCKSLKEIILPQGLTKISSHAFSHCESLEEVVIPDGVTSIDDYAFCHCTSLKKIVIPDSVTSIGGWAFENCKLLKEVILPQGLTTISPYIFRNCDSLKNIVIPNGVTSIGDCAFCHCDSLENVVIPDGVTSIGERAFYDCHKLDLNIETSLFYVDFIVFGYTFDVKKLTIYSENVEFDNYSYNFYKITLNKIRKKELLDKICKCLSEKNITDQICFQYDQHEKFIEMIIEKINKDDKYRYNDKELTNYVTEYITLYKSKEIVNMSFVQAENQESVKTISKKEQYNLKSIDDKPVDEGNKIPAYLYEYGLKVGMINEMEKIVRQIGKYLNLCDIPLKCEEHSGFIKEMIDCLLIDKNYNFNESMKYYIKWYIKGYKEKHKGENINNQVELPVQEGNNLETNKEIERLEQLKKELKNTQDKPKKKVSLKKL